MRCSHVADEFSMQTEDINKRYKAKLVCVCICVLTWLSLILSATHIYSIMSVNKSDLSTRQTPLVIFSRITTVTFFYDG